MTQRRRILSAKKIEILIEGLRGDGSLAEVCRRNGISTTQFYTWKKQFYKKSNEVFSRKRTKI
ncbi:transposase [candidate division WOR-3 bacterium]|nr:transposase [candidate division WOR-3 bacterium]